LKHIYLKIHDLAGSDPEEKEEKNEKRNDHNLAVGQADRALGRSQG